MSKIQSVFVMSHSTADEPTTEQPLSILIKDSSTREQNVSFTIEMKTILPQYPVKESTVSRSHSDFEWLHRLFIENEKYAGILVPPSPPSPSFNISRDALSIYTDDDNPDSEEYKKMRHELEREYLALFRKTVSAHDTFLKRISHNSILRTDQYLIEFLTSQEPINSKSTAATFIKDVFKNFKKSIDGNIISLFSKVKDPDRYFEEEGHFITTYCNAAKAAIEVADSTTYCHKRMANCMIKLGSEFMNFSTAEYTKLSRILDPIGKYFDRIRTIESKVSADEDLKLTDALKFNHANAEACKDLLLRRIQSLIASDKSLKALNKAKQTNQNVSLADVQYQEKLKKYESINESAKIELKREKEDRVIDFNKSFTSYCELQIQNLKQLQRETQTVIDRIEAEDCI